MKTLSFDINFAVSIKSFYMLESFKNNRDIYIIVYTDSTLIRASFTYNMALPAGLSEPGGPEGPYPQFLTDQSTPFQGADYANHITTCPPPPSAGFSDLPTSLT